MINKFLYIFIIILTSSILLAKKDIEAKKVNNSKSSNLYVFIAEKIEIKHVIVTPTKKGVFLMDSKFKAKYKVIKNIHNIINGKVVEFIAYDHYGIPAFSKYKYVLLYLIKEDGKFYHSKYQYSPLFKTKNNKWASFYSSDYSHPYNCNTKIKPVKINFKENLSIDITKYSKEIIKRFYPKPYFKIKGNKAYPKYGNYIKELFQLKKDGVLKARGYF